jgi:hypothetical protein
MWISTIYYCIHTTALLQSCKLVYSWEVNSCSAGPRNSQALWNLKVHIHFTKVCHWILLGASLIHFTSLHHTSLISIWILFSHLYLYHLRSFNLLLQFNHFSMNFSSHVSYMPNQFEVLSNTLIILGHWLHHTNFSTLPVICVWIRAVLLMEISSSDTWYW